jgi:molybdopterin molybdotransferase
MPRVGILSTGDEVVAPDSEVRLGQVRDVNSYTLSALVDKAGGAAVRHGIIPDDLDELRRAAQAAHEQDDLVIITAGSSVSAHDVTSEVIHSLGKPGVLVHGVSIRPGKPTILAVCDGTPVVGLPGNPVSALVIAGLFVAPVVQRLSGMKASSLASEVPAELSTNLASETGRVDYVPVRLVREPGRILAEPVYGRSNLIFTLVRADGLIRIPAEATGLRAGAKVFVQLF